MPRFCQRCSVLAPLTQKGVLWLCAACELTPACGDFAHSYAGHADGRHWACLACGTLLAPQLLDETAPASAAPAWEEYDY